MKCFFAALGNCGGESIPCQSLLKPSMDDNDHATLFGCYTIIESLLLYYGKIGTSPHNMEQNHVCDYHSRLPYSSSFKSCCLCKPFGRSKSSKSGLRMITKLHAFAAWKQKGVQLSFGRKMCTQCRNDLEKLYITEQIRCECDALFSWLYDANVVHTPSISSSDSHHVLSQSIQNFVIEEKLERLKDFLHGNLNESRLSLLF